MYVHTLICLVCLLHPSGATVCVNPLNVVSIEAKGSDQTTVVLTDRTEYVVQGKPHAVADRLRRCE